MDLPSRACPPYTTPMALVLLFYQAAIKSALILANMITQVAKPIRHRLQKIELMHN